LSGITSLTAQALAQGLALEPGAAKPKILAADTAPGTAQIALAGSRQAGAAQSGVTKSGAKSNAKPLPAAARGSSRGNSQGGPERALARSGAAGAQALGLNTLTTGSAAAFPAGSPAGSTLGAQPSGFAFPGIPGAPPPPATGGAQPATAGGRPTGTPTEQVALQIRKAVPGGAGSNQDRISIKLHPAELGRVEVKLELSDDGLLRAQLAAERPETLELLQRDARSLEKALQEAGLQLDSGSLSFNLHSQGANGEHDGEDDGTAGDGAPTAQGDPASDGDAASAAAPRGPAHDGLLDLTV
jgi:hypothetical protein